MYLEKADLTPSPRSGPDWYKEEVISGYVTKFQPKKHEGKSEHFWRNFSIFQESCRKRKFPPSSANFHAWIYCPEQLWPPCCLHDEEASIKGEREERRWEHRSFKTLGSNCVNRLWSLLCLGLPTMWNYTLLCLEQSESRFLFLVPESILIGIRPRRKIKNLNTSFPLFSQIFKECNSGFHLLFQPHRDSQHQILPPPE